MNVKKVLFINQGITPYIPETAVSLSGRKVPQSIQESGREIRTFLPQWGCINERRNQLHEVIRLSGMNIIIDGNDHPLIIKVASLQPARMQVYFIDNDDYFEKRGLECDESGEEYADNGERAIFYARGVIETVKKLRWHPDVIHCQGWVSAIAPLYIRTTFKDEPTFAGTKIVFEANDAALSKPLPENFGSCLLTRNVTKTFLKKEKLDLESKDGLMKLGVHYSDAVILGGGNVSKEISDYAASLGKPTLPFVEGADYAKYYGDFYETLFNDKQE